MSVFAIDLYFASNGLPASKSWDVGAFMAQPAHWRVMADLALLSLFAGLYSVPMYALIQIRSQPTHRARIIAANNILNALFMIASSVIAGALLRRFTYPADLPVRRTANAVVAAYIFLLVPEYLLRFVAWIITRCVYRFKVTGDDNIPTTGPAILACNHVSFIDAVLLLAASPRPIYFVMDHRIFKDPGAGLPSSNWPRRYRSHRAPKTPRPTNRCASPPRKRCCKEGDLLAIFPEGGTDPGRRAAGVQGRHHEDPGTPNRCP
jgi:hypothetical protein